MAREESESKMKVVSRIIGMLVKYTQSQYYRIVHKQHYRQKYTVEENIVTASNAVGLRLVSTNKKQTSLQRRV
jgi:hypothetical protein